jgi:hypothetical protein
VSGPRDPVSRGCLGPAERPAAVVGRVPIRGRARHPGSRNLTGGTGATVIKKLSTHSGGYEVHARTRGSWVQPGGVGGVGEGASTPQVLTMLCCTARVTRVHVCRWRWPPGRFPRSPRSPRWAWWTCGTCGTLGDMAELPNVIPVSGPRLSQDDLVDVLSGLDPGWYVTRDLLPRVNVWLTNKGREPVSAKTLGESIAHRLKLEGRYGPGHRREFHITLDAVAGRDWFVDTPAGTDLAAEKEQP